jgi:hypothetical protein
MATTRWQHHKTDKAIIHSTDLYKVTSADVLVFPMVEMLHTEEWSITCARCDHLISFMPTSTYKVIWRALSMPHHVTCRTRWGMPLKQLGTSFSRPRILGKTGLTYVLSITANHFNIFSKILVTGWMSFRSQLINSIHNYVVCLLFFPCVSCCHIC